MSRSLPALVATAALLVAAVACSDPSAPAAAGLGEAAGRAGGTSSTPARTGPNTIRGHVIGIDSSQTTTPHVSVAGASVHIVLREHAPAPGVDSSAATVTLVSIGTVTSDANGRFEMTGVPAGYYALEVTPPAGSPFRGGTAYSISFAPGDDYLPPVYLAPRD